MTSRSLINTLNVDCGCFNQCVVNSKIIFGLVSNRMESDVVQNTQSICATTNISCWNGSLVYPIMYVVQSFQKARTHIIIYKYRREIMYFFQQMK